MQQNDSSTARPSRQGAVVIVISLVVFLAAIIITIVVSNRSTPTTDVPVSDPAGFEHIHGLGVDPGDGTLYVASHFGVFRVVDGEPERVADRYQDTMGFAVIGPKHFLGSGHPDLREDLPASLGLIESTDGAETWQSLSLLGEADLHAIEPTAGTLYAIDAAEGALIATDDNREWRTLDSRPLLDLAATPSGDQLLATTPDGTLLRYLEDEQPRRIENAPPLSYIDWGESGLVGTSANGDVFVSQSGESWERVGSVTGGEPGALNAHTDVWYLATGKGVFASSDSGRTWTLEVEAP